MSTKADSGLMRISQRQPSSCVECSKRKTKCDKCIPCSNCQKRGIPEKCRIEQVMRSKSLRTVSGIKKFREETRASQSRLEQRIKDLEGALKGNSGRSEESGPSQSPIARSEELELVDGKDEPGSDDEAEAAGAVEFLTMGRSRRKSPGAIGEEVLDFATLVSQSRPSSDDHFLFGSGSVTPRVSDLRDQPRGWHFTARQMEILDRLPSREISRLLVVYDIENVAWMHCSYFGPILRSEVELFWSELGEDGVEVNWNFLALLFAVMASAVYHIPSALAAQLFPNRRAKDVMERFFNGFLDSLHEANWMHSHSLYSVEAVAIIISPANHLDKADLYYTMLGTAIRIAQALNIHRLSANPPKPPNGILSPNDLAQEVKKRTWHQLIIQDWFHVAFNGTNSIHASQFTTAPPRHINDKEKIATLLSEEIPNTDSHTIYLVRIAAVVNRLFSHSQGFKRIPYNRILQADCELRETIEQAPRWMTDNEIPLDPSVPRWVEWQRHAFMVSSSHKFIVVHRQYVGRAFRGDERYRYSRETSISHAKRIVNLFLAYDNESFRKTWTVIAHVVAAILVIGLDIAHAPTDDIGSVHDSMLDDFQQVASILASLATETALARKSVIVLECLLVTFGRQTTSADTGLSELSKPAREEMQRSINVLLGTRDPIARPTLTQMSSSEELVPMIGELNHDFVPGSFSFDDSFLSDQFLHTLFGGTTEAMPWDDEVLYQ